MSTDERVGTCHTGRVFTPVTGDVVLRGSIDGRFTVLDALTLSRIAGPFTLQNALTIARRYGARTIFQQRVDERGRNLADPVRFALKDVEPS